MTQVIDKLQPWLAALEERPQGGPRWLQDLRERGASRFSLLGFPTTREEEWHYTSLAPLAALPFTLAEPARVARADLEELASPLFTMRPSYMTWTKSGTM